MIPTGRLVALAVLPTVLGGVAIALPAAIAPMIAVDVVLLVVAVADLLASRGRVEVVREVEPVQAVGRPSVVRLAVRSLARRRLELRLVDEAPGDRAPPEVRLALDPGERAEATYTWAIRTRGAHRFEAVTVRWRTRLGLFERQHRMAVPSEVRVYPSFRQLRSWGLLAREDERRAPVRARRKPGGENEFERLRPYVRGDSYRHVDWRATARRRALVTREFGQESNQNILFLIDAGRTMSAESEGRSAFDQALDAAMVVGQVALRRGDRVGLLLYDDRVRAWMPPRGGTRAGAELIRSSYDIFPTLREADHALAMRWVGQRVRRRSLVVLLTSVIDPANAESVTAVTRIFGRRHLPLCVWLRDPSVEALAQAGSDPYAAGAAAELLGERSRQLQIVRDRGALVLDVAPDRVTSALLSRYLEIKARRLL